MQPSPSAFDEARSPMRGLNSCASFRDRLAALLRESDGVAGEYGLGLVWPLERIVRDNLAFRADAEFPDLYMPFDSLLFFADAGNGDQFAFAIRHAGVTSRDIYVWKHEDDSRTWVGAITGHVP